MDSTEGAVTPAMRHRARHFVLQALYTWQMTGDSAANIEKQYLEEQPVQGADLDYFHDLVSGVIANCDHLDETYEPFTSRPIKDLDEVDKAILRLSTFELLYRQDVPPRVVINEGIMLAKEFAQPESHKFVNGVLDKVYRAVRTVERKTVEN